MFVSRTGVKAAGKNFFFESLWGAICLHGHILFHALNVTLKIVKHINTCVITLNDEHG